METFGSVLDHDASAESINHPDSLHAALGIALAVEFKEDAIRNWTDHVSLIDPPGQGFEKLSMYVSLRCPQTRVSE
jgi:hypothetical protein